ncbi:LON peptidase substrate-binding domain-containing protein [Bradyrhizobium lablabi]|uniref:LON peptidase substrate-binding domain-containing protein n=1 Tax=Bradyrhizobium lablabi TaxID=722472 RepID=UPI001BAB28EF|nr:LON peptidase substrate-binding domain-containing protein [Bradyrhizobium lablabi]MBR1121752.1 LON peptidase substrate-binding domain-containing protein [Bradyrhizobium lablabi]
MRDFRDAKAMAQTLRHSLVQKSLTISHSESLELVSKMLGAADWNTLSALIQAGRREGAALPAAAPVVPGRYPAIPLRDFVPFPTGVYPLFAGRPRTMRALEHAFEQGREVVVAIQRDAAIDEPTTEDFYEVGVMARLLHLLPLPDGTSKVLAEAERRVTIHRFLSEGDAYQADIGDITEAQVADAPELIRRALERFKVYIEARGIKSPWTWPSLHQLRDPGLLADVIGPHIAVSLADRQMLLATLDPVARLEKVESMLAA